MSKVYYASARIKKWRYDDSMPGKLERLLKETGLAGYFGQGEWVAVKTHFGSEGAHRIVRPVFLRKVVDALKEMKAKPFVTEPLPESLAEDEKIEEGQDILLNLHKKPYLLQVEEAERLGLGSRGYELVELK